MNLPFRMTAGAFALLLSHSAFALDCDAGAGQKVFQTKCSACHALDSDRVGPHLAGVVGRPMGSVKGFTYSPALVGAKDNWSLERLETWLTSPARMFPETTMAFGGLRKAEERKAVLCFLQSQG
ncbi:MULTISPECIES: c-type cytochrome [unclassified Pseudomonas]|uniref:c-type cytochrome n=1 Tax=unclassified Pseudomonas TaxID=196821 RepID=UPI00129DBD5E|nr:MULTISPECIES: c-type cytochrome [unclassified Pseudomonas]MDH4656835.1 c-type cytochrome [Pseudomonas sp. BN606]MRK24038.1 c-type cytochrome [Pseudomonas sp. JG-B]